ncbi:MAG: type III-B CRISPR-associated protein Cas10/Cmr2 [Methylococcaceae bacterium]
MPEYLISIAIGPVQDFIAAARRTRDLWAGSFLLSEISKAAAKSFHDQGAELIFPTSSDLDKDLSPINNYKENAFNVGNKILVIISTDKPDEVLKKAKKVAQNRWETIANIAREKAEKDGVKIEGNLWNKQVSDVLELYGAWKKLDANGYKKCRELLDKLLSARKNTREFIQNPIELNGIAKSSLDGLRENVIQFDQLKRWTLRKAGLNAGEYLDCTGVVKRLGQNPEQFTPISRLAVEPWLQGLPENAITQEIKEAFEALVSTGLCSRVKGNQQVYNHFPFDGQLLYPFRREAEKNKLSKEKNDALSIQALGLLNQLEKAIEHSKLHKDHAEPSPYMVILAADGDRMGELLDKMQSKEEHRIISRSLSGFATDVAGIVRGHQGHCIYAGGDDVLALLPLHTAIECSRDLARSFKNTMEQIKGVKMLETPPTLSVGLGISHFMNPMPKQLDLARKAEQLAKGNELERSQQKNALAVIIQPRSGASIRFREHWDYENEQKSAETILYNWINAHNQQLIPRQAGYNLRDTAYAFDWVNHKHSDLIQQETERIMGKKRDQEGNPLEKQWIQMVCDRVANKGLLPTADELIMTYRIAQAYKLAGQVAGNLKQEKK